MKKIYNIFIDPSFIRSSESIELSVPLSTEWIRNILDFIKDQGVEDKVNVIIPEIALKEIVFQRLEIIKEEKATLLRIRDKYKKLFNIKGIDISKYNSCKYKDFFEKKCNEFIKKNKLKVAKIPSIPLNSIIERAVNKKPPFQGKAKESDKGFKDTIMWHSIIQYCKDNKSDLCLLCAGDQIFKADILNEELKKINGTGIKILGDPSEVIEFLSVELKLEKKEWKNEIENIKNKVKGRLGEIIKEIYKENYEISTIRGFKKVISYDIIDVEFIETYPGSVKDEVVLRLKLNADCKGVRKRYGIFPSYEPVRGFSYGLDFLYTNEVEIKVSLKIDKLTDKMEIEDMSPEYPLQKDYFHIRRSYL